VLPVPLVAAFKNAQEEWYQIYVHFKLLLKPPAPTIGDDIKVLYDPSDPGGGASRSFSDLWCQSFSLQLDY